MAPTTAEHQRLAATREAGWNHWGPYLGERAWGTVREDYSADGDAWGHFPHDHARSRAYRWNEDGLAGVSDSSHYLCLALSLWNEHDPILKERLFGLTAGEGNHGEDVKEYYFYLDNTPTHSYMKMLYKYPQVAYPYALLLEEARKRSHADPELELFDLLRDTFEQQRYFDVVVEYAKASPEDLLCRISVTNRGPDAAPIYVLPHLWYRNTWRWNGTAPPQIRALQAQGGQMAATTSHPHLGDRWWYVRSAASSDESFLLFTENNTNDERVFGGHNLYYHVKDSINDAVVGWEYYRLHPHQRGSKVAARVKTTLAPGETFTVQVRFADAPQPDPFATFDATIQQRAREADEFYQAIQHPNLSSDERLVQRQAFAGLLWSKQFYHYDVACWLYGDPAMPEPFPERLKGRNAEWPHFAAGEIISVPDTWEHPWFDSWNMAFQCVPLALVDPEFARSQLLLACNEWYQHPTGQIPASEQDFSRVTPPVLAWAAWQIYQVEQHARGTRSLDFLERMFHKLLISFTWWANRRDPQGRTIFQGGFLGVDAPSLFDRNTSNTSLPRGNHLEQSDGTSWMGMFCLNMLSIALELACQNPAYEDIASKFFEHFLYIAHAMNNLGEDGLSLWDKEDEFYYDVLHCKGEDAFSLKARSFVSLIPLFAVAIIEPEHLDKLPTFRGRLEWFLANRPHLARLVARWDEPGEGATRLAAVAQPRHMRRVLQRMLDPSEFLSPFGVRSLSHDYRDHPYVFQRGGTHYTLSYQPAESNNSSSNVNWHGPIWMPINYLIIDSLRAFHRYHGDTFKVEFPTGSGELLTLREIASNLARRLVSPFLRVGASSTNHMEHASLAGFREGERPVVGENDHFQHDPHWRDYIPFHEYFHGDTGAGLGASHHTGWTALVALLIQECGGAGQQEHEQHEQQEGREEEGEKSTRSSSNPVAPA